MEQCSRNGFRFNNPLNQEGLVDDYADFIQDYVTSGIANQEFLEQVRREGIDGILISELSTVHQQDGAYGRNAGQTRITLTFTVIDTRTSDVVWTASADGIKGTVTTVESAPPLVEAVDLAVAKIEESVPRL